MKRPIMQDEDLPSLKSLQAFALVGQVGGIRKAARLLNLDHTVVSRRLQALEAHLKIQLFERTSEGLSLTEKGQAYYLGVSEALRLIQVATHEVQASPGWRDIRVWAVPGFAARWLSGQLAVFERQSPGFTVELRPTDRVADLLRHEADADIRYYGDDWGPRPCGPGTKGVELARPPLMAVASPSFLERHGSVATLPDLLSVPLLHEEDKEQWNAWLRANGVESGAPDGGIMMWHAHLAVAGAREGRGVALANAFLVEHDIRQGNLVALDIRNCTNASVGCYWFVCREDCWNDPPLRRFRQFLSDRARGVGA